MIGPVARAALYRYNLNVLSVDGSSQLSSFDILSWQPLLALDLVRRLCKRQPNERLSAFQALNHPWLRGDACDSFRAQPQTAFMCTYKLPPSCRYASRPGQPCALCPMMRKFGYCAFTHPLEDFNAAERVSADVIHTGPELCMAQLSTASAVHRLQLKEGQQVRLLRHNCEDEIGWSCVQIHDVENGVCEEGLVATCCIGLPQGATADWQPPTYDVDTHKFPSVFKQARAPSISSTFVVAPTTDFPASISVATCKFQIADGRERKQRASSSCLGYRHSEYVVAEEHFRQSPPR
jgi:hypothetical protein